ncbi:hypothetical protein AEAC466_17235 [Asticcacaulis sp. AC466]|uniref:hypothetical protein n=1 Tax=Asticcacaulis sp. AC466 TaxID=1282362 RepID=UPI0003C3FFF6|nr:hypothetical protein [Asticcacaulis sp. AC466]ESQ82367.1 hypothetical protein AEAC466_17235 [Asticcacaulis sp. AC466]
MTTPPAYRDTFWDGAAYVVRLAIAAAFMLFVAGMIFGAGQMTIAWICTQALHGRAVLQDME